MKTTAKRKGRPRNSRLASDLLEAVLGGTLKDLDGLFRSGANVNPRAKDGFTPLMLAIGRKDPRITACLIEQGADVKARNEIGQTPLMIAAVSGQRAIAEQLIAAGADVRAVDNEKRNAISWAASRGDFPEVISLLGVSGGDYDVRDLRGMTPLMRAALMGFSKSVGVLLTLGADETISSGTKLRIKWPLKRVRPTSAKRWKPF